MDPARGTAPGQGHCRLRPTLNWDLWLGTAPQRPYAPGYHPSAWRGWQDFGTGWSGDIGCHLFNVAYQGLELTAPQHRGGPSAGVVGQIARAPRRHLAAEQSHHVDVSRHPPTPRRSCSWSGTTASSCRRRRFSNASKFPNFHPSESTLFIGTEGVLFWPSGGGPQLWPQAKFHGIKHGRRSRSWTISRAYVEACLGGPDPECKFSRTGPMSRGRVAGHRRSPRARDKLLQWDAAKSHHPRQPRCREAPAAQLSGGVEGRGTLKSRELRQFRSPLSTFAGDAAADQGSDFIASSSLADLSETSAMNSHPVTRRHFLKTAANRRCLRCAVGDSRHPRWGSTRNPHPVSG